MNQPEQNIQSLFNTALSLQREGRIADALVWYGKVLKLEPSHLATLTNMGSLLHATQRYDEAIEITQKAILADEKAPLPRINLAAIYSNAKRPEDAEQTYQELIKIVPSYAVGYMHYAMFLLRQGNSAAARELLEQAIDAKPDFGEAHYQLALLSKYTPGSPHIQQMQGLLATDDLANQERMFLGFAMGVACNKAGLYEDAFAAYASGNRLRRKSYPNHTSDADRQFFDRICEVFTAEWVGQSPDSGIEDATPIFIVGMPRSGTTLVEQILASHSTVEGAGELMTLQQVVVQGGFQLTGDNYPNYMEKLTAPMLEKLGQTYLEQLRKHSDSAAHITDKMPANFRFVGMIRKLFPKAKIIHCVREPIENCWSIYKTFFSGPQSYAYQLDEIAEYYLQQQRLMEHWKQLYPGAIHTVSYEKMVEDTEAQAKSLLAFCGLGWQPQCLEFYKTKRKVETASMSQVREPIYKTSLASWKNYEKHLSQLQQKLS